MSEQAIAPLGESKSNVWLFSQLAQRMGFTESCFQDSVDDLIEQALEAPATAGITRQDLEAKKSIRLTPPSFADGVFATRSGKIELYSSALEAAGIDALPTFHPPDESRRGSEAHTFPLEFLPRKADNFMNSTFANLAGHQKMETPGLVFMHAHDASARQIGEADWVEIYNARGKMHLRARIDGSVPEGVVAASLNWNKLSAGGNNVNALTSERLADMGGGATFYSTLVEVRKLAATQNPLAPID
jgi:anaerobic selenocysteine-containing dehydrogenase